MIAGQCVHGTAPASAGETTRHCYVHLYPFKATYRGDLTMASEAVIQIQSNGLSFTLPTVAFQGLPSTLCKGCGHNSITSYLIEACKSIGVNPYNTIKLSGIGCSSKTPAYFLQASHGFNALHGRMPSVATGATGGQFQAAVHRHQRRRRHGQYRHGTVQAHLPPQCADRLHRREQRLLRPDEGTVFGDGRLEPAPAAADRGSQRRCAVRPLHRGHRRRCHVRGAVVRRRQETDGSALEGGAQAQGNVRPRHHQPVRHLQRLRRLDQELGLGQGARRAAARRELRAAAAGNRGRAESRRSDASPAS